MGSFRILLSISVLLFGTSAQAEASFEVIGTVYEIIEPSPLVLIETKINDMEQSGEYDRLKKEYVEKTKQAIYHPKGINLPRALVSKYHYYDPSIVVQQDMYLPTGQLMHKKGTRINPLEFRPLTKRYIFIDQTDEEQVEWAYRAYKNSGWRDKVVLVKGSFVDLYKRWKKTVYFDQLVLPGGGQAKTLVSTFGVEALPTIVSQEKNFLKVEVVVIGEKN